MVFCFVSNYLNLNFYFFGVFKHDPSDKASHSGVTSGGAGAAQAAPIGRLSVLLLPIGAVQGGHIGTPRERPPPRQAPPSISAGHS